MRNLGAPEIILILVVLVLLFGAKRLPDLSRSLGRSMRIFKSEIKEMHDDDKGKDAPAPAPPTERVADTREIEGTVHRADPPRQSVPEAERRDS
ncbi:MAG: Sec-independent protein translocase subunit TatA [Actinomycetes bacterium]